MAFSGSFVALEYNFKTKCYNLYLLMTLRDLINIYCTMFIVVVMTSLILLDVTCVPF